MLGQIAEILIHRKEEATHDIDSSMCYLGLLVEHRTRE